MRAKDASLLRSRYFLFPFAARREGSCQEGLISQITTFEMFPATFSMVIISKILVIRLACASFEALAVMAFFYVFFLYLTLVAERASIFGV